LKLSEVTEGRTRLFVPRESVEQKVPPTSPVFFNPAASTNRDVAVAIVEAAGGSTFCDSLAGVGARGIRVANEVRRRVEVAAVDMNGEALRVARRSARANGVEGRVEFHCGDAREFLHSRHGRGGRFDFVDVDPFGSPAPFLGAAVSATADGGVLSLTATDTAALCGVYPAVSRRRYSATPLNNHFHHETGARILLNAVRREAAKLERGMAPLAAHSTLHYIRVYARVSDGALRADESLKGEGYVAVCASCQDTTLAPLPPRACEKCGGKARWAGPLWAGPMTDPKVLKAAAAAAKRLGLGEARAVLDALAGVDAFPPWGYSIDLICSRLRVATVPESDVRRRLADAGFRVGRQPFEKTGLKTDAPYAEVLAAVRGSARR
jgi:tRNA (guanine26-N2/guanine27-N2)-dimethyltransferase